MRSRSVRRRPEARRAAAAAGDIGAVALAARHATLDEIAIGYHAPIAFMLATPIPYGEAFTELAAGTWLVEDKFDGIRVQAHVTPERVSLFSRTLSDASAAFPEIAGALRALPRALVLDGEIVAERDGRVLPFRYLQARLQRKDPPPELLAEVPVRYAVFDLLACDERVLLDEPLSMRRALLSEASPVRTCWCAPPRGRCSKAGAGPAVVHARFADRANAATRDWCSSAPMRPTHRAGAGSGG